jgi:hypothetical protein
MEMSETSAFISIDVVGHSSLSGKFSPESINLTLMNLRNWLNDIISHKNRKELNWTGDGGIFYFLQEIKGESKNGFVS